MYINEIRLNKEQFKIFNELDQFQLFTDEDGFPNYEDFDEEVDKLFEIFEYIIVTDDDYIYGFRNGKKELISDFATEGYSIALEVTGN